VRLVHFLDGVFSFAPSLLCRTFGLIHYSLIWLISRFRQLLRLFASPFPLPAQPCRTTDPYSLVFSFSRRDRGFRLCVNDLSTAERLASQAWLRFIHRYRLNNDCKEVSSMRLLAANQ
jgi:hypothetical protein